MSLEQYLNNRRAYEASLWIFFVVLSMVTNSIVVTLDLQRLQEVVEWWEPWSWEGSSTVMILLLIPVMLIFDQRFSLHSSGDGKRWRQHLLAHFGFSIIFSLLHVGGMVLLRHVIYWTQSRDYNFGNWAVQWSYEYLKDFRTYFYFLIIIYAYRFILRRLQGEASLPKQGEQNEPENASDRFLIKKLGKEFLVKVQDIDWLEASGNYVTLHANGHMYPLRGTMTNLENQLATQGFLRTHRSAIINLKRLSHLEALENGDAKAHLQNGQQVAVSRRYRTQIKEQWIAQSQ